LRRAGGYTRILKLARPRKGDAGVRVRLELSEIKAKKAEKEEPKKK